MADAYKDIRVDLSFIQGDGILQQFGLGPEDAPIDMTGWAGEMKVRYDFSDASAIMTLSTSNGGIILDDPEEGLFSFFMTGVQSAAVVIPYDNFNERQIPYAKLYYDIEFTPEGGQPKKYVVGQIKMYAEVTK